MPKITKPKNLATLSYQEVMDLALTLARQDPNLRSRDNLDLQIAGRAMEIIRGWGVSAAGLEALRAKEEPK